jgi:uncharacterized protein YodC (DUF2158 family)
MSQEPELAVGDTVCLMSGGHSMTVVAVDDGVATCDWSVKDDIKTKKIPVDALHKSEPPTPLRSASELSDDELATVILGLDKQFSDALSDAQIIERLRALKRIADGRGLKVEWSTLT